VPSVSLAKLGLKDGFVPLASAAVCKKALETEATPYLAPSAVLVEKPQPAKLFKKLIKRLPALRKLLATPPPPAAKRKKAKKALKEKLEEVQRDVAKLGKMAPAAMRLGRGSALARVGKTEEAQAASGVVPPQGRASRARRPAPGPTRRSGGAPPARPAPPWP